MNNVFDTTQETTVCVSHVSHQDPRRAAQVAVDGVAGIVRWMS